MVSSADFTLPPVDTGRVLTSLVKRSALARLVPLTYLPATGGIFHTFSSGDAEYVAEGGLKPLTPTTSNSIQFDAAKFTKKLTISDEVTEKSPALVNKIYEEMPASFAVTGDEILMGDRPAPIANFDTLADVPSLELDSLADFYDALVAVSATGASADSIFITTAMLYKLKQKVNAMGAKVFEVSDDRIEGVPYAAFESSTAVAFVGPFRTRAVWGVQEGYPKVTRINGAITMPDGTVRTLDDHNEIGLLAETKIGLRFANKLEFRKLVPAAAV